VRRSAAILATSTKLPVSMAWVGQLFADLGWHDVAGAESYCREGVFADGVVEGGGSTSHQLGCFPDRQGC
jgi:hypothetical protein